MKKNEESTGEMQEIVWSKTHNESTRMREERQRGRKNIVDFVTKKFPNLTKKHINLSSLISRKRGNNPQNRLILLIIYPIMYLEYVKNSCNSIIK